VLPDPRDRRRRTLGWGLLCVADYSSLVRRRRRRSYSEDTAGA